jgi:hypothetical protein
MVGHVAPYFEECIADRIEFGHADDVRDSLRAKLSEFKGGDTLVLSDGEANLLADVREVQSGLELNATAALTSDEDDWFFGHLRVPGKVA